MSKRQKSPSDDRLLLLQMIEEAYRLPNWNETNLRSALRRVDAKMAAWRPRHAKRSIAEIAVHCGYWKYGLRRRLTGEKRGSFPLKGSNWPATPQRLTAADWKALLELLEQQHEQLCQAIGESSKSISYARSRADGQWTMRQRVFWLAIHDGYHTGQINLIKAMYRRARANQPK